MGVGGHRHAPADLLPGKTRYSLYGWLAGLPVRSGPVRKISPPTGIRPPDRLDRSDGAIPALQYDISRKDKCGRWFGRAWTEMVVAYFKGAGMRKAME
jgi:hypothetical protein